MSTFRNAQIDEILNYERQLNRTILDRTIAQVTHFNDERRPPTNRDIKFEAIIGTMVDNLKEKIAKALQAINNEQYTSYDTNKVENLLYANTGEYGIHPELKGPKPDKKEIDDLAKPKPGEPAAESGALEGEEVDLNRAADARFARVEDKTAPSGMFPALTFDDFSGVAGKEAEEEDDEEDPEIRQLRHMMNILSGKKYDLRTMTPELAEEYLASSVGKTMNKMVESLESGQPYKPSVKKSGKGYSGGCNDCDRNIGGALPSGLPTDMKQLFSLGTQVVKELPKDTISQLYKEFTNSGGLSGKGMEEIVSKSMELLGRGMYGGAEGDEAAAATAEAQGEVQAQPAAAAATASALVPGAAPGTAAGLAVETSRQKNIESVESSIYAIVADYNGLIDKILNYLMPDGKYHTQRASSSSHSGYFASVIKGLLEPLRQLVFELAKVHNPQLQSLLNMTTAMVDVVDQAPPFQKIDTKAYKNGRPDFQGLSDAVTINDIPGYIALLEDYKKKLQSSLSKYASSMEAILFNVDPKVRKSVVDQQTETANRTKQILGDIEQEINKAKERKSISEEIDINDPLLKEAMRINDELKMEGLPDIDILDESRFPVFNPDELIDRLRRDIFELNMEIDATEQTIKLSEQMLPDSEKKVKHIAELEKKARMLEKERLDKLNDLATQTGQKPKELLRSLVKKIKGGGFPKAELLANPKEQYYQGRKIPDDDEMYRDLVQSNKEWQAKSNPVHTTPVGKLYPFEKKDEESKYTFPARLRKQQSLVQPVKNAYGADVSLLQGGPSEVFVEKPKRKPSRKTVTAQQLNQEYINADSGRTRGGASGALKKIVFDDEKNEMFEAEPLPAEGMVHSESEEEKKDRFLNPKLAKKKKKSDK